MDYLRLTPSVSCDESVQRYAGAPLELLPGSYRLKADTDGVCCWKTSAPWRVLFNISMFVFFPEILERKTESTSRHCSDDQRVFTEGLNEDIL